ncbi:hypothetical protein [uncultured Adlercreutzia sp.]|uniref:hypothetical protein n=1 Tax=uncultured Adlercreutzia sp. TaxID=875803 RepID=UPI00266CAA0C|nr:hypothetical protein [uncultured Adlercreutzia sp.]
MAAKDPKDMTVSELLRLAANGEENEYGYRSPRGKLFCLLLGMDAYTVHTDEDRRALRSLADKIDDERGAAYSDGFIAGKNAANWSLECDLAAAKSWPARKEDETIREYISRCFLPLPRFEDGEPVRPCDEWKAILMSLDGARFQLLETYPDGLRFTGDLVKRPAPEVLGADGLPIKEGETVWLDEKHSRYAGSSGFEDGNEYSLCGIERQEMLTVEDAHHEVGGREYIRVCMCSAWCHASWLTHTPPETQERIDADKKKLMYEYWECKSSKCGECPATIDGKKPSLYYGVRSCSTAQGMDIARRQRELDKRTGGAE